MSNPSTEEEFLVNSIIGEGAEFTGEFKFPG
ncbi:polymer-forming cytoskeletal protein, partial [Leptospira selangorensis]